MNSDMYIGKLQDNVPSCSSSSSSIFMSTCREKEKECKRSNYCSMDRIEQKFVCELDSNEVLDDLFIKCKDKASTIVIVAGNFLHDMWIRILNNCPEISLIHARKKTLRVYENVTSLRIILLKCSVVYRGIQHLCSFLDSRTTNFLLDVDFVVFDLREPIPRQSRKARALAWRKILNKHLQSKIRVHIAEHVLVPETFLYKQDIRNMFFKIFVKFPQCETISSRLATLKKTIPHIPIAPLAMPTFPSSSLVISPSLLREKSTMCVHEYTFEFPTPEDLDTLCDLYLFQRNSVEHEICIDSLMISPASILEDFTRDFDDESTNPLDTNHADFYLPSQFHNNHKDIVKHFFFDTTWYPWIHWWKSVYQVICKIQPSKLNTTLVLCEGDAETTLVRRLLDLEEHDMSHAVFEMADMSHDTALCILDFYELKDQLHTLTETLCKENCAFQSIVFLKRNISHKHLYSFCISLLKNPSSRSTNIHTFFPFKKTIMQHY